MHHSCIEVWASSFCNCNTLCFIIRFCFWRFHIILLLWGNLNVKFFFIKFTITNIFILLLCNFKNQVTLQFPCPSMIKVIMQMLFAVVMTSLFLPRYKCMNESFSSKVSIKSNGNVTCVVELLILLLVLNKLLKTNNFNSIVISALIILLVVSTQQVFSQNNFSISSIKEFLFYCYLNAIRYDLVRKNWCASINCLNRFQVVILNQH